MAPVAFTLCSNNYFSMALTWADSMRATNPEYITVIGLVDKLNPGVDYPTNSHVVIAVDEVKVPNIDWMVTHYNIVEFNTAVKPFYFEYLFEKYSAPHVLYFDPDMLVYSPVSPITSLFDRGELLLTPHVNKPIDKSIYPWENHFLKHGIYNLGFAGLRRGNDTARILEWWQGRLREHCFANAHEGLYVDQLWANYFPLFFDSVVIVRHPGANVAFWNLHERDISTSNGKWTVNGEPLIFFHFSSFNPASPSALTKEGYSSFDLKKSVEVQTLAKEYASQVMTNHFEKYRRIPFGFQTAIELKGGLNEIGVRINRKERILNLLLLRLIKKERLIGFVVSLLRDYAEYDMKQFRVKTESVYTIEGIRNKNEALRKRRNGGIMFRLRLLASSFISFIR